MSWHIISYDQNNGQGSYVLKMEPGAQTVPHMHMGFEEFLMIEGELIDSDGTVFKKGEFISFKPNSQHSSFSETGALIVVFQRGLNEAINQN
jgi:anti-sigma factor ChrR (cupin superfamily)